MSRLGAGPDTQLFCRGPAPRLDPGSGGAGDSKEAPHTGKGSLLLEGTWPRRHHVGSRAGSVTHGGSEEAHRCKKRPSTATLGTGNPQQCGELLLGTGEGEITAPWAVCEQ